MSLPSSYHRANNHDDGPFRAVDHVEDLDTGYRAEVGVCGHRLSVLRHNQPVGKRRRCWNCKES